MLLHNNKHSLNMKKDFNDEKYEFQDQSRHLHETRKELLRCLDSFNPFDRVKIERLKEDVRILENNEKERIRILENNEKERIRILENNEKERIRLLVEDREREEKVISYSVLVDDEYFSKSSRFILTRTTFQSWLSNNKMLYSKDDMSPACTFEEVVVGNDYVLEQILF